MPIENVEKLVSQLNNSGLIKSDTTIAELLKIEGVGDVDPIGKVASTIVAWDGYVAVYKGQAAGLEELQRVVQPGGPV